LTRQESYDNIDGKGSIVGNRFPTTYKMSVLISSNDYYIFQLFFQL